MQKNLSNITFKTLGILLILVVFSYIFTLTAKAAVGFSVGNSGLILGQSENLFYGNVAAGSHASSSLLLLQKNSADIFKVDNAGNLNTTG